jgi:hypothetical protein
VLILSGEIHDLSHFGLRHFVGVDAALAHTILVDMQHDLGRFITGLAKEPLKHVHDEFHRRVIIVEQQNPVEIGSFDLGFGARDDGSTAAGIITVTPIGALASKGRLWDAITGGSAELILVRSDMVGLVNCVGSAITVVDTMVQSDWVGW